jgi:adenosylhomocysteine nucleosidase
MHVAIIILLIVILTIFIYWIYPSRDSILFVLAVKDESNEEFEKRDLPVIYTGVGEINAAYRLTRAIEKYHPGMVINYGTAGSSSLPIGSIVEVTKFIQHDMDATALGFKKYETPYDPAGDMIVFSSDGKTCCTGDTFLDQSHSDPLCDLVDMEAYALAKVCKLEGVRFKCFKYITDNLNKNSDTHWRTNVIDGAQKFLNTLTF